MNKSSDDYDSRGDYLPAMTVRVEELYPYLNKKEIIHCCNILSNHIRKCGEVFGVELSIPDESHQKDRHRSNYDEFVVKPFNGVAIWVKVISS